MLCLPEFSVYTAEYDVGPRKPVLASRDEKVSGDRCEAVDNIWVPRAALNVLGNAGEPWKDGAEALLRLEGWSGTKVFGIMLGGLIGVVCCCTGDGLCELFGKEGAAMATSGEALVLVKGAG